MRASVRAVLTAVTVGAGLVPAAAATNAFAASTATAPPGYQRVRSAPIPVPPGMFDAGGQVACPAGTVPWGGGAGGRRVERRLVKYRRCLGLREALHQLSLGQ